MFSLKAMTSSEVKLRRMKSRLRLRQQKLIRQWRGFCGKNKFQEPEVQLELKRVANLCLKLGVTLNPILEKVILEKVMLS